MSTKKVLLLFIVAAGCNAQNLYRQNYNNVVFPDTDTNLNRTATHPRKPVIDQNRCDKESELLYPGDNEADWVCDCRPAYVFYPLTQRCYPAFRQGPCSAGHYLVLTGQSKVPKCEPNPCKSDGIVPFQRKCVYLNQQDSCSQYTQLIGRTVKLIVDPTTLQLTCSDDEDNYKCANNCCIGGSRYAVGKCDNV